MDVLIPEGYLVLLNGEMSGVNMVRDGRIWLEMVEYG